MTAVGSRQVYTIVVAQLWPVCCILLPDSGAQCAMHGDNKSAGSFLCVLIAPVPNFLSGQAFGVELFAASVEQGDVITQTGIGLIPNSCPNTQQLYDEEKLVILAK